MYSLLLRLELPQQCLSIRRCFSSSVSSNIGWARFFAADHPPEIAMLLGFGQNFVDLPVHWSCFISVARTLC
jgi:hypothetical protein